MEDPEHTSNTATTTTIANAISCRITNEVLHSAPIWPMIDSPLGLSKEESVSYTRRFYKFRYALLPLLWAVNLFWPILCHYHSFPGIRPYLASVLLAFCAGCCLISGLCKSVFISYLSIETRLEKMRGKCGAPGIYFVLNTGVKIPAIGFGTWHSGGDLCVEAVKTALTVGYLHIDCAHLYGNEIEVSEALDEAFRGALKREDVFLTSKLYCTMNRLKKA